MTSCELTCRWCKVAPASHFCPCFGLFFQLYQTFTNVINVDHSTMPEEGSGLLNITRLFFLWRLNIWRVGLQLTNVWSTQHRWKSTWLCNTKHKGRRNSEVFGRWTKTAWPDVKTSQVASEPSLLCVGVTSAQEPRPNTSEQYIATWSDLPHP